ncbi:hypothetical protein EXW35_32015 (plasmid) [Bacillus mycoides]|uniref:hypothetical protein n=1 Tax=Bacillus TaxID=1386 RepID=UPI001C02C88B|nr:hypothetical protein [Bacillus mycoides]QWG42849.1 hypothetical protein EXW35_32015 [Bacillus mycoides]
MLKFIWAIVFALIIFFVVRSTFIPYIASNENIVALFVIFTIVIINSWIIGLINRLYKRKTELDN